MPDPQSLSLEINDSTGLISRLSLSDQNLLIGRAPESQIRLDRATVSRRHAEIFRDPFHRWWVRDMGSRNKTYVNGQAVTENVIRPGDTIGIGEFVLKLLSIEGSTPIAQPPQDDTSPGVPIEERAPASISRLHEIESPRIAATHISILTEFGQQLLQIDDPAQRQKLLCSLMVRPEFLGRSAMILRASKTRPSDPPRILCAPESSPQWKDPSPYISRSLLKSLRQKEDPAMASNIPSKDLAAEISISPDIMAISAVACPIRSDEHFLDLLYVILPPHCGTGEWLALAALATKQYQQAESLAAARLQREVHAAIERELDQARQIQTRLVPRNLAIRGLDLAIGFKPCRWVGGDYVDVVKAPDGRILLTVADVCGKGMPAALLASSLHATIRVGLRTGMDLPGLMRHLNEHLQETNANTSFITMICLLIDPKTGQLECVNAGHPAALLIDPSGSIQTLQVSANLPLGVSDDPLESQHSTVSPGQLIFLYTDGLPDVLQPDGQRIGTEGLKTHVQSLYCSNASLPAAQLADQLNELLDRLQGECLSQDDRTFLLAKPFV